MQDLRQMFSSGSNLVWLALALVLLPAKVAALEYRSVSSAKAVLYDAPSAAAKKIFLLSQGYPVEIIVNLGDWLKVRDAHGSISWMEAKELSDKRTVLVSAANAEIRTEADAASGMLAKLEKDVVLEVVSAQPVGGWLKVKHRDGITGFILISSIWGYN